MYSVLACQVRHWARYLSNIFESSQQPCQKSVLSLKVRFREVKELVGLGRAQVLGLSRSLSGELREDTAGCCGSANSSG